MRRIREELGFPKGKSFDNYSFMFLMITIMFMFIVTTFDSFVMRKPTTDFMMGMGSFLFIFGVIIRLIGSHTLGKHYSLRVIEQDGHELVKGGIYGIVRHPLYTGGFLMALGFVIFFNSEYGAYTLLPLVFAGLYRIKVEESFLAWKFGDNYIKYKERVKGLIPYLF
ncbi:MAG: isoprenylcysteine carboxylmethyltransferase family protein [Candidatus Woesearchaeota archaeon]